MADLLNMSVSGYGKIERNRCEISLSKLKCIAEILEVDYLKILSFDKHNLFTNINGSAGNGSTTNQLSYTESEISMLIKQLILDNQEFKSYLSRLLSIR